MCIGRDGDFGDGFEDRETRHAFIRKVFMVVGLQLLVTAALCVPFMYVDAIKFFVAKTQWPVWVCLGIVIVIMLLLGCVGRIRRSFPLNVILLAIFTLAQSYIVGALVAWKYPIIVLIALGITVAVCTSLIIFAFQAKCDFTGVGPYLMIGVLILLIMGIISIFIRNRIFMIAMCSLGVFVFSLYLIVDVQMMVGGKHKYQFDEEDWVMAAISIYIDIITIFTYLLNLIGLVWD